MKKVFSKLTKILLAVGLVFSGIVTVGAEEITYIYDCIDITRTEKPDGGNEYTLTTKNGYTFPDNIQILALNFINPDDESDWWDIKLDSENGFNDSRTSYVFNSGDWSTGHTRDSGAYKMFLYVLDGNELNRYMLNNGELKYFEAIFADDYVPEDPENLGYGPDNPEEGPDGPSNTIFENELRLSFSNGIYTLNETGTDTFVLEEDETPYIRVLGYTEDGDEIWYGNLEVNLSYVDDEGIYTFRHSDLIPNNDSFDSGNYFAVLYVSSPNGDKEYKLTDNPVYFDKMSRASYHDNRYFDRETLELSYDEKTETYSVKMQDGSSFEMSQNDELYKHEVMFFNSNMPNEYNAMQVEFTPNSDKTAYTFTLDNISSDWDYLKNGNYHLVLRCSINENHAEYALNDVAVAFGRVGGWKIEINNNNIDSNINASLQFNSDGTYTIITNDTLPIHDQGLSIVFVKDDNEPNDEWYYEYGAYFINRLVTDGNGYTFSKENYDWLNNEDYTSAGEYMAFLRYWGENGDVYIPLTNYEEKYFESSHTPLPKGATITPADRGIYITTAEPNSNESKAWFDAILRESTDASIESSMDGLLSSLLLDDIFLPNQLSTYLKVSDGLFVSYETIIENSVRSGNVRAQLAVKGYQMLVLNVNLLEGAIHTGDINVNIYQEDGTHDLIIESDNLEYLQALRSINAVGYGNDIYLEDTEDFMANAVIEKTENGYQLRYYFYAFGWWPMPDDDIVYDEIVLGAYGYTKKVVPFDGNIVTGLKEHPDVDFILTSKGLILRSYDYDYLQALNSGFDDGKVEINFTHGTTPFSLSNENGKLFEGVHAYENEPDLYYTYISSDTLRESDALDDEIYGIYISSGDVGYTDYLPTILKFDLTKIINIYDEIIKNKDKYFEKHHLKDFDEDVKGLGNVKVYTHTDTYDDSITIDGITTGAVITDNKGGIDDNTLAYENQEDININVNISESSKDSSNTVVKNYAIVIVDKSFDINVNRKEPNKDNENIIELPLNVLIEIDGNYKQGNRTFKILKTHTDAEGNTTQELLDLYYDEETNKHYFYTNQFSNFQVVEVEEICLHPNATKVDAVNPTCTTSGNIEYYTCEDCETLYTAVDEEIVVLENISDTVLSALGHTENVVKDHKEPTCVEKGYTEEIKCKVCGETITASTEIDELGHKEVTTKEAKDPTCTEAGHTKEVSCERCEEILVESTKIEALGHKYENGKCTVCQEVETGDIDTSVEDLPTIDTSKPVEEVVVGTDEKAKDVLDETVNDIVENIISGDKVENIDEEVAEEIKQQIEAGKDVEVVTEVVVETLDEEKVDEDHIALIVETVKGEDKDAKVVQYLDLSVLLNVVVNDKTVATSEVTELSKPMTFTIAIPEEMKEVAEGYTRIYFIVRVHNGVSETLPVTVNDNETLSFSTDKFSTYALAYKDVENSAAVTPEKAPTKTGDDTNTVLFAGLAVLAAGTMYVLRRKKENE